MKIPQLTLFLLSQLVCRQAAAEAGRHRSHLDSDSFWLGAFVNRGPHDKDDGQEQDENRAHLHISHDAKMDKMQLQDSAEKEDSRDDFVTDSTAHFSLREAEGDSEILLRQREIDAHILVSHDATMGKMHFQDFAEEEEEDARVDSLANAAADFVVHQHEDGERRVLKPKSNKETPRAPTSSTKVPKVRTRELKKSKKETAGSPTTGKTPKGRARELKKSKKETAGAPTTGKTPKGRARELKKSKKETPGAPTTGKTPKVRERELKKSNKDTPNAPTTPKAPKMRKRM